MASTGAWRFGNGLMHALPEGVRGRWSALAEPVAVACGQLLHETNARLEHVYFPITAVASLLNDLEDGSSSEVAIVGSEGMVGLEACTPNARTVTRAVVHTAGLGVRLPARAVSEASNDATARFLFQRFAQSLLGQMSQTCACSRRHTLEQQMCRWILAHLDRVSGQELSATHELIAARLGVRRESVTACALSLRHRDLVSYSRGRITVLDRIGLERLACECHRVVAASYAELRNRYRSGCIDGASCPVGTRARNGIDDARGLLCRA